jgi:hypothetical protein
MDLGKLATDMLGQAIGGATTTVKTTKKTTRRTRIKSSAAANAADMINTDNLGKAASDVMGSANKVDGFKKAAVDLLDKNGDGNIIDDVIGGFLK